MISELYFSVDTINQATGEIEERSIHYILGSDAMRNFTTESYKNWGRRNGTKFGINPKGTKNNLALALRRILVEEYTKQVKPDYYKDPREQKFLERTKGMTKFTEF